MCIFSIPRKPSPASITSSHFSSPPSLLLFILTLLSAATFWTPAAAAPNHEATALYSWLHSSASPPPPLFSSWTPLDTNPCKWDFITCTSQELVSEINIQSVKLELPFPANLSAFTHLEKLVISEANITGTIPAEIGDCSKLTLIDLSSNSLVGPIPSTIGRLWNLQDLILTSNLLTGKIPVELSACSALKSLVLVDNRLSGNLPKELGVLQSLEVLRVGGNHDIVGEIPEEIANCGNLTVLGLAETSISGSLPASLSTLPQEIGNCSSLVRLRLGNNRITGIIPKRIGGLKSLTFLDFTGNRLSGPVPDEIGSCVQLEMVDLSNNALEGRLPDSLSSLSGLQILDLSNNRIKGPIPESVGHLISLNNLILNKNLLSGPIPPSLGHCLKLQKLDLSRNELSGSIPVEIGKLESLAITLNLSWNGLTGQIPNEISSLTKLFALDLSHNKFGGSLSPLAKLENLLSLDVSFNNFTGDLPDNNLFRKLSPSALAGNHGLCISVGKDSCFHGNVLGNAARKSTKQLRLAIALLITMTVVMVFTGIVIILRTRKAMRGGDDDCEIGESWTWQFTPFQKLNFSVEEVLKCLVDSNIIGKGCSGIVYRANMDNGEVVAVKKLWPISAKTGFIHDSFSTEVRALGSVRHKNIVRFLGCCWNRKMRLLMFDYKPNGSLGSLLHERNGNPLEWETRYQILLGAAQGIAYLHHDCVPPIVHRDIKANNILIGLKFEPYIADFGLAKLVDGDFSRSSNTMAGSYGYIAPEYGYALKISNKSDVYSYGVVMLEVLTGKQPIDPTIPDGVHIVDWVRKERGGVDVLEPSLCAGPNQDMEEMTQALGIALLCVNPVPSERPTMKDVAAMLSEIKREREEYTKVDVSLLKSGSSENQECTKNSKATSSSAQKEHSLNNKGNDGNRSFTASTILYSSSSSTNGNT
ncbi:unnamed protein product [Cuscuta europaea]|uniref:non-specific serine/threonine protein kinase n=1 Tax=Cuscuta europaea TaxID=41803 RepID=A0A9P0YQF6_CUSEU|nr:unnamed protein product [Cuscuta europaea]